MILDIKYLGDDILRQIAKPVNLNTERKEITILIENMIETLKTHDKGVGIAAPQVGISKRLIVVKNPDNKEFCAMINPIITWTSFDKECLEEGCLSVIDKSGNNIRGSVFRFTRIRIEYETLNGEKQELLVKNHLFSRIIQHEIDHLDGKLFIDYLKQ